ncbi:MAG: glycosyltransferase [bacterium]|nr:glycosyltransferase [bacterium]
MAREEWGAAPESVAAAAMFEDKPSLSGSGPRRGQHVSLSARQRLVACAAALLALILGVLDPHGLFLGVYWGFFVVFLSGALIRVAAICTPRASERATPLSDEALPPYTLIVPLYGEAELAGELVAHLNRLDYPRDRLQALIVLEADDLATRSAFRALDLPAFIQVLVVPPGSPRTKPRACNVALNWTKGDLVVIYDAEDAPDPLQLREAAARFAVEDADLACLQAPLRVETPSYPAFIPHQFQLEYAALFEVLLPAYARWGLPFPLGGTSNHFNGIM